MLDAVDLVEHPLADMVDSGIGGVGDLALEEDLGGCGLDAAEVVITEDFLQLLGDACLLGLVLL